MMPKIVTLAVIALPSLIVNTQTTIYAFSITHKCLKSPNNIIENTKTQLGEGLIEGDKLDGVMEDLVDPGLPPVKQAQESVSILFGNVEINGDEINPVSNDLKLYSKLTPLPSPSALKGKVLCKGTGIEVYREPGSSTERDVTLSPTDAVENALSSIEANSAGAKVQISFVGGDDLMVHEVIEGVAIMTSGLNLKSSIDVEFRSLCHESFPLEKCCVVALDVDKDADGEIYWHDDKWWTVSEDDFTPTITR